MKKQIDDVNELSQNEVDRSVEMKARRSTNNGNNASSNTLFERPVQTDVQDESYQ